MDLFYFQLPFKSIFIIIFCSEDPLQDGKCVAVEAKAYVNGVFNERGLTVNFEVTDWPGKMRNNIKKNIKRTLNMQNYSKK